MNAPTICILFRQAPYGHSSVNDGIDLLLAAAAFTPSACALFIDDGVFCCVKEQNSDALGLKQTSAVLKAAHLYDIAQLYVAEQSIQSRGLLASDLLDNTTLVDPQTCQQLLAKPSHLFSF